MNADTCVLKCLQNPLLDLQEMKQSEGKSNWIVEENRVLLEEKTGCMKNKVTAQF